MDADFSHNPADVPRLLATLEDSADFVIGSRHVKGGSIPAEWSVWRKLNSAGGNWVARYIVGLYGIRDCTAGFRAIRASILRQIDFGALRVKGYAFQVALLHQAVTLGAVVKEVPVDFIDRKQGQSKLGLADIVEFVLNAWWIRLRALRTFIRFALVGASGTLVNLGVFTGVLHTGLNKYVASALAIEISIIWNFFLNNYWTFKDRRSVRPDPHQGTEIQPGVARHTRRQFRDLQRHEPVGAACPAATRSAHRHHSSRSGELLPELVLDFPLTRGRGCRLRTRR